ncbi:MAG TPA: hypothetical protein VF179_13420, partial [Thermoanaerobaculia bacterium]|nr:hypothetical protein [Thermoanaerobaculia bacterium]
MKLRDLGKSGLVGAALLLVLPSMALAAEAEQESSARDKAQKEAYLQAVPYPGGLEDESDLVRMHSVRNWYLMTYPTGQMPSSPWSKAKKHNNKKVGEAAVWEGEGLVPPGGPVDNGVRLMTDESVIAPGTNTWVSYGPKPLDTVGTTNNAYRYGITAGRVSAGGLAIHPTAPSIAYAGFTAGGLWKTTNLGSPTVTWTPLWDDKDFV